MPMAQSWQITMTAALLMVDWAFMWGLNQRATLPSASIISKSGRLKKAPSIRLDPSEPSLLLTIINIICVDPMLINE